jgi:hypothetical protein
MGLGRNGAVLTQWSNVQRYSPEATDHNGYLKEISNPASMTHLDASFENPAYKSVFMSGPAVEVFVTAQ